MNKLMKNCALLLAFVCMVNFAQAQKFGYVNSQVILSEMPEVLQAQSELETLQKQLQAKGQGMLTALQTKYQKVQQDVAEGKLSPKQQEEQGRLLQAEEAEIAQFEQQMMKNIKEKELALLQPVYDKVNNAIKAVAEENGYTFIFDQSTQILLYAQESSDVSSLIKTKLGI